MAKHQHQATPQCTLSRAQLAKSFHQGSRKLSTAVAQATDWPVETASVRPSRLTMDDGGPSGCNPVGICWTITERKHTPRGRLSEASKRNIINKFPEKLYLSGCRTNGNRRNAGHRRPSPCASKCEPAGWKPFPERDDSLPIFHRFAFEGFLKGSRREIIRYIKSNPGHI